MGKVAFVRYSPHTSSKELTTKVVECYRQVFADGPWHEWKQCSQCKRYWGLQDFNELLESNFEHCGVSLVDFWSTDQVTKDLFHEIKENASCWLAISGNEVIGFCWGYPVKTENLETKLGVPLDIGFNKTEVVAYQDEVGVLSAYRGSKIAKTMVTLRLNDFLAQGLEFGIVRTKEYPEPSKTFLWYTKKLGYKVIASYPETDGRVILGRKLCGLKLLLAPKHNSLA